jgi:hypothetical protein
MMSKLILFLYFMSGAPQQIVEVQMTREACSQVMVSLADVRSAYKAEGVDGLCIYQVPLSSKSLEES